jgi:hypothetical protein
VGWGGVGTQPGDHIVDCDSLMLIARPMFCWLSIVCCIFKIIRTVGLQYK